MSVRQEVRTNDLVLWGWGDAVRQEVRTKDLVNVC